MLTDGIIRSFGEHSGKSRIAFLYAAAAVSAVILGLLVIFWRLSSTGAGDAHTAGTKADTSTGISDFETSGGETYTDTDSNEKSEENGSFYISDITDDIFERIDGCSYNEYAPVSRQELRYVHVLYNGTDGEIHEGELIVNEAVAEDVLEIFCELYEIGYVIESMVLVDSFEADDNESMLADNTSAFNARLVDGTDVWSYHAYGYAIDINPLYNPYVGEDGSVLPEEAELYADRTLGADMMIDENDECYRIFTEHGFTWGGSWMTVKDYMHFEKLP